MTWTQLFLSTFHLSMSHISHVIVHYVFCTFFWTNKQTNKVGRRSSEVLLFTWTHESHSHEPCMSSRLYCIDLTGRFELWPIKTLEENAIKLKTRQVIVQTRKVWQRKSARKNAAVRVLGDLRCSLFRVLMDWWLSLRVWLNVGHKDQFYIYWHLHSWVTTCVYKTKPKLQ